MERQNLFNENFVDLYPRNLSSAKLRRYTVYSSDVSRYFEGFVCMLFLGEAASDLQQLRSHMAIVHLHAVLLFLVWTLFGTNTYGHKNTCTSQHSPD